MPCRRSFSGRFRSAIMLLSRLDTPHPPFSFTPRGQITILLHGFVTYTNNASDWDGTYFKDCRCPKHFHEPRIGTCVDFDAGAAHWSQFLVAGRQHMLVSVMEGSLVSVTEGSLVYEDNIQFVWVTNDVKHLPCWLSQRQNCRIWRKRYGRSATKRQSVYSFYCNRVVTLRTVCNCLTHFYHWFQWKKLFRYVTLRQRCYQWLYSCLNNATPTWNTWCVF